MTADVTGTTGWTGILAEDDYRFYGENISLLEEQVIGRFPDSYKNTGILSAIRNVPRHLFVNKSYRSLAYTDNALPTCGGLTTSAPSVIAEMIFHCGVERGQRLLEIGTGTGYEAAVLSEMGVRVFSVEIEGQATNEANRILAYLGYKTDIKQKNEEKRRDESRRYSAIKSRFPNRGRIRLFKGNGRSGIPRFAPYNGIIFAVSIPHVRHIEAYVKQLSVNGGRLVVPVGRRRDQSLYIVERKNRRFRTYILEDLSFDFLRMVL